MFQSFTWLCNSVLLVKMRLTGEERVFVIENYLDEISCVIQ